MKTKYFSVLVSLIVLAITVISCNHPLNVPITKVLPPEVIKEVSQSDTSFVSFIESLHPIHTWITDDEEVSNKYGQITYEELYKYRKYAMSISYSEVFSEYCEKYPEYNIYKQAADSIINQYSMALPKDAVSVKLVGKETKYDWFNGRYPVFVFEIESHIGRIDQLAVWYSIQNKIYSTGKFEFDDSGSFHIKKPFSGTTIVKAPCYVLSDTILHATFTDLSYEDIYTNYETFIKIADYQADGRVYSRIPYEIRAYYENKDTQFKDLYFYDIIKTFVAPNFTTPTEYYIDIENEKLKNYNKRVHEMCNTYYKRYEER